MKTSPGNGEQPIILIVEDSRAISAELQRNIISRIGFRAEVVSTYADAREFLNWNAKDIFLAILDLNLADASGDEVVDLFCSMAVPSIVFTADITESTRKRMLTKEIIDYVVKDVHAVRNIIDYVEQLVINKSTEVLVIEDSDSFRFSLCAMLHQQMFQVIDVPDAESGLAILEDNPNIDVVITDFEMPGMNGIDLTKRIRSNFSKDEVAIIGLSGTEDPMLSARFIKSGASDFLTKPFEAEEFHSRVGHVVETLSRIRALDAASRDKNRFLGMVVHDLRSPINGIKGLSEMLLEGLSGELNEEQREYIEYIHEANMQMNHLVNDLLDISVIESGRLKLARQTASLEELIRERMKFHSLGAKKKNISIDLQLDEMPSFAFDARRVGQAFDNLVSNALKFSPFGETIDVITERKGTDAQVCIRDRGQGVPPDEAELVFLSFEKTSVRPTGGESSTGLGLPIVRKVVEAHGGRVWVESEYGKGASFYFTLPMESGG